MEIRVTIDPLGNSTVETVSVLEDLWHDFEFFRQEARRLSVSGTRTDSWLLAKTFSRSAIVTLAFYLEGVINRWLEELLPSTEWKRLHNKDFPTKLARVEALAQATGAHIPPPSIEFRTFRNKFAHLKRGGDLALYDEVTPDLLDSAAHDLEPWLTAVEAALNIPRHPDTRLQGMSLANVLGTPRSEAYSSHFPRTSET